MGGRVLAPLCRPDGHDVAVLRAVVQEHLPQPRVGDRTDLCKLGAVDELLSVLELREDLLGERDGTHVTSDQQVLQHCSKAPEFPGSFAAVPPVRAGRKQSLAQRNRRAATRAQLHLAELPFGPALVAEPSVGLMPDTVSTHTGVDRLLTLRSRRSQGTAGGKVSRMVNAREPF